MQFLQVQKIIAPEKISTEKILQLIDDQGISNKLDQVNWASFPYKPQVDFRIMHYGNSIYLKFDVIENAIRGLENTINGEVYKDSCVEFFFSPDGMNYYNFEFNCIGTPHVAYGNSRHHRQHLPIETVQKIQVNSSLGNKPIPTRTCNISWQLWAVIPVTCMIFHPNLNLEGLHAKANFYKCGDALPEPHFVTWNPVETDQPDYHRPEFFGNIVFD